MTLTCVVLEDQAPARRLLEDYAARHPDLTMIGATALPSIGREMLEAETVDLLFLDLSLPQADGFAFLRGLSDPPVTIVTTAFPNRAIEGYEAGVADYLVKPISYERFCTAVDRAKTLWAADAGKTIEIQLSKTRFQTVNLSDIHCLSADGDYVRIHTQVGDFHVSGPLSDWQHKLPASGFARIHRSHIVNLKHVSHRNASSLTVAGHELPVGRKYLTNLTK